MSVRNAVGGTSIVNRRQFSSLARLAKLSIGLYILPSAISFFLT